MVFDVKAYGDLRSEEFPDGLGGVINTNIEAKKVLAVDQGIRDLIDRYGFLVFTQTSGLSEIAPSTVRGALVSLWHVDDLGCDYSALTMRRHRQAPTTFLALKEAMGICRQILPGKSDAEIRHFCTAGMSIELSRCIRTFNDDEDPQFEEAAKKRAAELIKIANDIRDACAMKAEVHHKENQILVFARKRRQVAGREIVHGCIPTGFSLNDTENFRTGGSLNMFHIKNG